MIPKKVFVSGYYGFANTGDEAILTVLLGQLRERIPGVDVTVVSGRPEVTAREHEVEAVLWSDPLAIGEAVRRADLVITGGGGLFHDYTGFIPDALLTEGNWGLGYHVTPAFLASLYRKPFVLYAVGVGPLFSQHGKRYTRAACEAAEVVTVRDAESRDILVGFGVAAEKVALTADPAFALLAGKAPAGFAGDGPVVGVVVRHWAFGVHPVFWEGEVAAGLDAFLEKNGGRVVFLPFQNFPGEAENDVQVSRRVRSRMKRQEQAEVYEGQAAPAEMAALIAGCDVVVAMRLHGVIFSILGGAPFVALRYDPKVSQAVAAAGMEEFEIDLGALEGPGLAERMEAALAGRVAIRERLAAARGALATGAERNGELAAGALGRSPAAMPEEMLALLRVSTYAQLKEADGLRKRLAGSEEGRQAAESRVSGLEMARQALESQREALQIATAHLQQELSGRSGEAARLSGRVRDLEERLIGENGRAEEGWRKVAELTAELAGAKERLEKAESVRARTVAGLEAYEKEFQEQLGVYRSQRAWRVMLFCRKAYTRWTRRGLWSLLGWLPGALLGGGGLETEELHFALPSTRLPRELKQRIE